MESNAQIAETLNKLVSEISALKTTLPSSDLRLIQLSMEEFKHAQSDIKKDLTDLKRKLLDPDDGVIVKVNENTKFRIDQEKIQEREEREYKELILEHSELMKWKGGVTKAMWIFFTAIVGIVAKIFFMDSP